MSIIVCPLCHKGFRDSESRCPACGRLFSFKDWPVAEAYSTKGLVPQLTIEWADRSWSPTATEFVVGRSPGYSGLTLSDPTISLTHAKIYMDGASWKINRIKPEHRLKVNHDDLPSDECEIFSGDIITIGISTPLKITIEYVQKASVNPVIGHLESAYFNKLNPAEPLRIGSDTNSCQVVIKNIAPCNTIIYYQPRFCSWWIVDCASACGTKLNGEPIRNAKLFDGDKISIAGVEFIFENNTFVPVAEQNTGLAVNLKNLSAKKTTGEFLLHNIDLQIKPGEFVGILGPSGCGKSSLIQRLVGLGSFSTGEVTVNGLPYDKNEDKIKSLTAYVPQDVALHNDLTLDEEIKTFCHLHIKASEITEEKISTVLRLVQLSNERQTRIGDLSGGQRRRVTIMLELLRTPQMFLLDEPTAGLDPATETDIMLYLRRIANQGKTILCSTHILGNLHLFDKILVLTQGEMVFWGTPCELLSYFKVASMLDLYRLLGSGTKEEQKKDAKQRASVYCESALFKKYTLSKNDSRKLPQIKQIPSLFQQTTGYLYRQFWEFTSFRHLQSKDFFKEFFTSAVVIQLVIQPILISLVLKFACASYFYTGARGGSKEIFFFAAIAVFWLGLNSGIRELVKERTPWRCLERLEHVNIASYLSSKVIWTIITSLIQVSVFSCILYMIPEINTESTYIAKECAAKETESTFIFSMVFCVILFFVGLMGGWIGLAISAFFKKETPAVGLLPIVLIPVLFFSQPIMIDQEFGDYPPKTIEHFHECNENIALCKEYLRIKNEAHVKGEIFKTSDGQYNGIALKIKRLMPCHEPQVFMELYHNTLQQPDQTTGGADPQIKKAKENLPSACWRMIRNTLGYMLLSLVLMIYFQYRNEKKWEGR